MATEFDNTKYDVQINDVPYRVRGYQRTELSTFIPRLGSGEQSESEFDLLRSSTIKGFTGGELQRYWNDEESAYGIEGMYNKYGDGVLYPSPTFEEVTGDIYGSVKPKVTAWLRSRQYLFVASTTYNSPTTSIYRKDLNGTVTALTLPTALQNNQVTSMVLNGERLWIFCAYYSSAIFYMDLSSTTVNSVTGGSGYLTNAVVYRGEIYGTSGLGRNTNLYRYTGNTTTRSYEQVGIADGDADYNANLFIYNNRIILTRNDGMWGYDGIQLNPIETKEGMESTDNYKCPAVLKGYLYYFMPDGFYRFNGSLIEKLYDVSESGIPLDVCEGNGKLWYVYTNSASYGSTRYDKSMGYDYESGDNVQGRVSHFDGTGMYTQNRLKTFDKASISPDFDTQGEPDRILYFNGSVYVSTQYSKYSSNLHRTDTTQPTSRDIILTTSIFDAGFSQVNKWLENVEIEFDGDVTNNETFTVEYRIDEFEGDTGWETLGTLTSRTLWASLTITGPKLVVTDLIPDGVSFTQIQLRITADMSFDYGIKNVILRYLLTPEYKYQWTFTALCYGDDSYGKLQLQDQTESTQTPALLRGNIYESRFNNQPIGFVDCDYVISDEYIEDWRTACDMVAGMNRVFKNSTGYMQMGTEIIRYTKDANDTNMLLERGMLGTTATAHSVGTMVYAYYPVIVRQIQNERIEFSDEELNSNSRIRDSEITLTLQEV